MLRKSFSLLQHSSKEPCSSLLGNQSVQQQLLREHFVSTPVASGGCPNSACMQIPSAFADAALGATSSLFSPSIFWLQQDDREENRKTRSVLRAEEDLWEMEILAIGTVWWSSLRVPEPNLRAFALRFIANMSFVLGDCEFKDVAVQFPSIIQPIRLY